MKGHSYELEVPAGWRGSTVFYADRLRKYLNNSLLGQDPPRPVGETVDDEEEWEVERVVSLRL